MEEVSCDPNSTLSDMKFNTLLIMFPQRWCRFDVNDLVASLTFDVIYFPSTPPTPRLIGGDDYDDYCACVVNASPMLVEVSFVQLIRDCIWRERLKLYLGEDRLNIKQ